MITGGDSGIGRGFTVYAFAFLFVNVLTFPKSIFSLPDVSGLWSAHRFITPHYEEKPL